MNKYQRKIIKLSKIMYKLQSLNNPDFDFNYDKHYKKIKCLYKNISNKEYEETMIWCKEVLDKSTRKVKNNE